MGFSESGIEGEGNQEGRGEVRSEIGKVSRIAAGVRIMDSLGKIYGTFGGW